MSAETVTAITTALDNFANSILTNFVSLLPALATICAIGFVIAIVRKKINS